MPIMAMAKASICQLYIRVYGAKDALTRIYGPENSLKPGSDHNTLTWRIPETNGQPIAEIGIELSSPTRADGTVFLDYLTWDGEPECSFSDPENGGQLWRRMWVNGIDQFDFRWAEPYRLCQNSGRGLLMTGTREWHDYRVTQHADAAFGHRHRHRRPLPGDASLLCAAAGDGGWQAQSAAGQSDPRGNRAGRSRL